MYTIIRVRRTGEVNHLNITNKQEAINAYYFTALWAEDDLESFVGLFHGSTMLMNNRQRKDR